jgi:hypothetical protein
MSDRRSRPRLGAALASCVLAMPFSAALAADDAQPRPLDFNRDIRPVLSDNCYACHGPDKGRRKADLRLDTKDGLFSGKEDPVVAPGKPDESLLMERIRSDDPEFHMPPPKSGKALTKNQVELIRRWIAEGAEWKGHWAFLKPVRPEVPNVDDPGFVRNPIDRFLLARQLQAGLRHAPEADRDTLIRRLSLDLLGLPPSLEVLNHFREDTKADWYERLVDHLLLQSEDYGERMALFWLDLVRYGDTIGYHSDNPMNVWPYRDYVIRSFAMNKPFDRFTIEQLAGDLLPDANQETRVASGYNRLLQTTEEGGAQAKEYTAKYAADRVRNVSTVWLGATMGCAECHDHKFDPYTQRDFYSLAAFFADIQEAAVGRREAGMPAPLPHDANRLEELDHLIADRRAKVHDPTLKASELQTRWEQERRGDNVAWTVLNPESAQVAGESTVKIEAGGVLRSVGKVAARETYTIKVRSNLKGITGIRLETLADPALPHGGPGTAPDGGFVLSEFHIATSSQVALVHPVADAARDEGPIEWALDRDHRTGWSVASPGGWPRAAVFELENPTGTSGPTELTFTLEFRSPAPQHNIGKLRLSATTEPTPAARWVRPYVRDALAIDPSRRTTRQSEAIASHFLATTSDPVLGELHDAIVHFAGQKSEILRQAPTTLVTNAGPPRVVRLLPRGNWLDDSGPVMEPAVPGFLGTPSADGRRPTRLDLAHWIVSRENPLAARTFVNRLWKLYFGQGLAKILDDLGSQSDWPSHPELLDWLAVEFMESGWDIKHMVRLLVTSGAYRQSSRPSSEQKEHDPYNRLVGHQATWRLDAELVRDNALAISGLLYHVVPGGPSVMPYQPAGYWDQLNFPRRTYQHDHGPAEYRRGIYVHIQRTFPHPSLVAFDAPSREECTAERARSDIPQQALVLLNDPTYVEAARAFGAWLLHKVSSPGVRERLTVAFDVALARRPTEDELQVLADLFARHLEQYTKDRDAARLLVGVGETERPREEDLAELAAWTSVARVILNLHETITRS